MVNNDGRFDYDPATRIVADAALSQLEPQDVKTLTAYL